MRKSQLVDNIFKDLDGTLTKNQILSVLHLAECYGMSPPPIKHEIASEFDKYEWEDEGRNQDNYCGAV